MRNQRKISLQERDIIPGFPPFTLKEQLFVEPIIITPELHKTYYSPGHVYDKIFRVIWNKAREVLSKCQSLVIIGYSFPPTDFYTKKLFLESFSDNNKLKEVIVVNPNKDVSTIVKELCQFNKVKRFNNLEKFIERYP